MTSACKCLLLIWIGLALGVLTAAEPLAPTGAKEVRAEAGKSRALILVGLPGDREHETLFADTAKEWRNWLTGTLDFDPGEVRILFGRDGKEGLAKGPATRAAIEQEVAALKKALAAPDRLWVFFLGHGDYDGEHGHFHVPGRDLREDDLQKLFRDLRCREQVFWMTMSASGWFLRSLSSKGRIVIAATATDDEYNETEFPHALVTVSKLSLAQLDADRDGKVSVLELYHKTVAEVEARFAADKRAPTEHAQLDDNGDGVGSEKPVADQKPQGKKTDGYLASKTFLPFRKHQAQPR